MPLKQTFLERSPAVADENVDRLEVLLRTKIDLKTGYAEPHACARCMLQSLRVIDTSDDQVLTRDSFKVVLNKLNCADDKLAVDALFHRYDRRGTGKVTLKEFADGLFGLLPVAGSAQECRDIISVVRQKLLERGENGFRGLTRTLRILDDNGNKMLDKRELKNGMQTYGIHMTDYEVNTLMKYFDRNGDGNISVGEFVTGLRPKMSDARTALVKLAFLRLDKNPDGVVTMGELRSLYRAERNPAVLRGEKTVDEVLKEFSAAWNANGDQVITENEFLDYYKDLSATIDNDSYFELMVRNAWHISGGEGQAANTANLRLLVTHMDGTSTIETLDDDLGVDSSSNDALVNALRKQGVTDILKVETATHC